MSNWADMTRRERILAIVDDAVANLVFYARKEDQDLPVGSIEEAIEAGEVTIDELVEVFRNGLSREISTSTP